MAAKGAYRPQNPQLKIKKLFFEIFLPKMILFYQKNSPILHSDGFLSTLRMPFLDADGVIFSFLALV